MQKNKRPVEKVPQSIPSWALSKALLAGQAFYNTTVNLCAFLPLPSFILFDIMVKPPSLIWSGFFRSNPPIWLGLDFYPIFLSKPLQNKQQERRKRPKPSVYAGQDVKSHL